MSTIMKIWPIIGLPLFALSSSYELHYSASEFAFDTCNGYDRVESNYTLSGEPGAPELPADCRHYIIPLYASAASLMINESTITQMPDSFLIYPAQLMVPVGESGPWVPPDTLIYDSDSLFPEEFIRVVGEGQLDGARIITVEVRPLLYRPKSQRLYLVEDIEFEFVFDSVGTPALLPQIRGEYEQEVYDAFINDLVENTVEVQSYYQKPSIVQNSQQDSSRNPIVTPCIIITPSEFKSAFQPYADWLIEQGIQTAIVEPETIYNYYSTGRDNAENIRDYIKDCWQSKGCTWVILGGDDYFVPVRWCYENLEGLDYGDEDTLIPCDLYFAELTDPGDWNADDDTRWGELDEDLVEPFPEIYVGRISAMTDQEVANWVTKAVHYEKTPGVIFDTCLWIYSDDVGPNTAPDSFPPHFGHRYAIDKDADLAVDTINQGYAFLNIETHGNAGDFDPYTSWKRIHYTYSAYTPEHAGLNRLTNVQKYSIGYAMSCHLGAFDSLFWYGPYQNGADTCIADAFVDAYFYNEQQSKGPFGLCAFLCNTRSGWMWNDPDSLGKGPSHNLNMAFWGALMKIRQESNLEPSLTRLGVAENRSKMKYFNFQWPIIVRYYRYVCYGHNLFGSPVTEAWTKTPDTMYVTHPSQIPSSNETPFTVTVTILGSPPVPLQYAKVCLSKPDDIFEVASTDANGQVTFAITPHTTGLIKVTVTRSHSANNNYDQYYPTQTTCFVYDPTDTVPPSVPYANPVEKSEDDIVLTWNKVTTDTLNNADSVAYYVVYRDTFPSFVPDSSDTVGCVFHPDTTYTDINALTSPGNYYYIVKAVDWGQNKSKKSNMGYNLNKFFNENSGTTDRNWVSLPWHCNYDSVHDLTGDLSPTGDPLIKITNLRDDQQFENWLWDPDFQEWYGTDFDIISGRGYEMVTTKDTSLFLVGSNNPNGLVDLNENPSTTDKNWVSIPYDAAYSTVSDITDEYSPLGEPLTVITNLRNDQLYESWLWDPDFSEWYGTNFAIERGRGYQFVTTVDTTWNPTEYSNEAKGFCMARNGKNRLRDDVRCGTLSEPDRVPVWILEQSGDKLLENQSETIVAYRCADKYRLNPAISTKTNVSERKAASGTEEQPCKGGTGNTLDEKISHIIRAYIIDANTYSDLAFTAYCLTRPKDVLTENMIGSNTVAQQDLGALWFDVGNFKTPWKGGEEVVLIIEAIKQGKPYIDVENFKLDETVDIQELGKISLEPSFNFGSQGNEQLLLKRRLTSDNIIGYSMYKNDKRLNERILQDERSIPPDVSVKLVIAGGHETVYSSDGIQKEPDMAMPMSFAFAVAPNPFVKNACIDYALPKQSSVEIVIYDVSGRKVKGLASEMQNAGYYSAFWNGSDDQGRQVASGVYFIRFGAGEFRSQGKILLVR